MTQSSSQPEARPFRCLSSAGSFRLGLTAHESPEDPPKLWRWGILPQRSAQYFSALSAIILSTSISRLKIHLRASSGVLRFDSIRTP
jgi:hypothetical protein